MSVSSSSDQQSVKSAVRDDWDKAAAGWDAHTPEIGAWLNDATQAMFDMARIDPGSRVLDVAAGAGEQTLGIAQRVGARGFVLATDLSPVILALARQRAQQAGCRNIETRVADGESLPVEAESFDAAVCRLGLMLFPDPLSGLREMHRALRPGGGICTMVFSRPEKNPCVAILVSTALRHAGMPLRDPYQPGGLLSLGKPGLVDELFRVAGFQDVVTTIVQAPFRLPSAKHYIDFVRSSAGPIQQILGSLSPAAARAAWAEIEERLDNFTTSSGWAGPNELLLTAARH
jgi:ubiquinone/menaquinone biosynthesis C-methylase UbiE